MKGYYAQLTQLLKQAGFYFIRQGKGSHEIWGKDAIKFTIPSNCKSRQLANEILKQAKLDDRLK